MNVKNMCEAAGVSKKRLSELTGIPYSTLQKWIYGISNCPAYTEKLIEYYLRGEGYIKTPEAKPEMMPTMAKTKSMEEIYEMIRCYDDATLIYGYTPKGYAMYHHIETIQRMMGDVDTNEYPDEYDALNAAFHAMYRKYAADADAYVAECAESDAYKAYAAEKGVFYT